MELLPLLFLSFCFLTLSGLTFGAESGPPDTRVIVMEDDDVILPCSLSTNQNIEKELFVWKKEGTVPQKEVFMYVGGKHYNNGLPGQDEQFRDRVSHFPEELKYGNASIRIKQTKLEDKGIYTCIFPDIKPSGKTSRIELVVGSEIKVVGEGSDAILPCSLNTKESVVQKLFDWRKKAPNRQEVFMYNGGIHYNNGLPGQDEHFRGRVSHFPLELQFGNASIIIRNTTVADSGVYTCDFPRLQPEQTFSIKLVVVPVMRDRFGDIPGAAPKPIVHVLKITEDEARLKCEVRGAFPKPKVEWRDEDGNILPAEEPQVSHTGERYNITLLTTVTRTNSSLFHCVATQEEIGHVTENKLSVNFCENLFKGTSGQVIISIHLLVGWIIGILSFALLLAVLVATRTISIHTNRGCLWSANKSSEDPPAPDSETGPEELKGLNKDRGSGGWEAYLQPEGRRFDPRALSWALCPWVL
ncbi:CD276 antigen homolog [Oreochromis aureus]|uniref:CD276 antigen homolog n=1 Tax=Oreochromis aureus TaxID=47969 RepID=UPI001953BA2A|nr:CD276 antigen homolog [Oreochromis aureus]